MAPQQQACMANNPMSCPGVEVNHKASGRAAARPLTLLQAPKVEAGPEKPLSEADEVTRRLADLRTRYWGELDFLVTEFTKLEAQLGPAVGPTSDKDSQLQLGRLQYFIPHVRSTMDSLEQATTLAQLQRLEEHITQRLLPVKERLLAQLAAAAAACDQEVGEKEQVDGGEAAAAAGSRAGTPASSATGAHPAPVAPVAATQVPADSADEAAAVSVSLGLGGGSDGGGGCRDDHTTLGGDAKGFVVDVDVDFDLDGCCDDDDTASIFGPGPQPGLDSPGGPLSSRASCEAFSSSDLSDQELEFEMDLDRRTRKAGMSAGGGASALSSSRGAGASASAKAQDPANKCDATEESILGVDLEIGDLFTADEFLTGLDIDGGLEEEDLAEGGPEPTPCSHFCTHPAPAMTAGSKPVSPTTITAAAPFAAAAAARSPSPAALHHAPIAQCSAGVGFLQAAQVEGCGGMELGLKRPPAGVVGAEAGDWVAGAGAARLQSPRPRKRPRSLGPLLSQPRQVLYECSVCKEAYEMCISSNPWWALFQQECPKCHRTQIPRVDPSHPSNTVDGYHAAILSARAEDDDEDGYSTDEDESDSDDDEEEDSCSRVQLSPDQASKLMVLMAHARMCPGQHEDPAHREVCRSTKYLMLHVRDCSGQAPGGAGGACPHPWCRPCKSYLGHLLRCPRPDKCPVYNPQDVPEQLKKLRALNQLQDKANGVATASAALAAPGNVAAVAPLAPKLAVAPAAVATCTSTMGAVSAFSKHPVTTAVVVPKQVPATRATAAAF